MRHLLKFKTDSARNEFLVKWEADTKTGMQETFTMESTERPTKKVLDALEMMGPHLCEIAELPDGWLEDMTILGVTITRNEGVQGLVITATRELEESNAPLVLNSPHFTDSAYSEGGDGNGKSIYSDECADAIAELEKLAFDYIDGKEREQQQLELTEKPTAVLHALN